MQLDAWVKVLFVLGVLYGGYHVLSTTDNLPSTCAKKGPSDLNGMLEEAVATFTRSLERKEEVIAAMTAQLEQVKKAAATADADDIKSRVESARKECSCAAAEEAAKKARDEVDGVKRQLESAEEAKRGAVAEKDKLDAALKDKEGQVSRLRDDLEKAKKSVPTEQASSCDCSKLKALEDQVESLQAKLRDQACPTPRAPQRLPCPNDRLLKFHTNFTQFVLNTFAVAAAATTPNNARPLTWLFSDSVFPTLKAVPKNGLVLEFGVFKGDTLSYVADQLTSFGFKGYVGGFDSWEGLPVKWRELFDRGEFGPTTHGDVWSYVQDRFKNRTHVHLHKGWFRDTIPILTQEQPRTPITHLHVDGDLFVSAALPLQLLTDRIVPGTLITFDELYKYKGYDRHEILELFAWMGQTGNELCALANRNSTHFQLVDERPKAEEDPFDQSLSFQVVHVPGFTPVQSGTS